MSCLEQRILAVESGGIALSLAKFLNVKQTLKLFLSLVQLNSEVSFSHVPKKNKQLG